MFIVISDSSLRESHVSRRYYSNNRTIMNLEKNPVLKTGSDKKFTSTPVSLVNVMILKSLNTKYKALDYYYFHKRTYNKTTNFTETHELGYSDSYIV